jgi:hypothetical protein
VIRITNLLSHCSTDILLVSKSMRARLMRTLWSKAETLRPVDSLMRRDSVRLDIRSSVASAATLGGFGSPASKHATSLVASSLPFASVVGTMYCAWDCLPSMTIARDTASASEGLNCAKQMKHKVNVGEGSPSGDNISVGDHHLIDIDDAPRFHSLQKAAKPPEQIASAAGRNNCPGNGR